MKDKNIVVLLKYFKGELNPFDGAALECALQTGANVTAVSMSPLSVQPALQALTRLGVKAVLISDPAYAGSDTQATSYILAEAVKRLQPHYIFCGRQSVDGDTAQVPPMLAQRLGLPILSKVIKMQENTFFTRAGMRSTLQERSVITFEKIKTLRFPSIFSKAGEVEIWDNKTLGLDTQKCGLQGSPTRVVKSYESTVGRRNCTFVQADSLKALIEQGLQKDSTEKTFVTSERLSEVYYVGNVCSVAERIADKAIAYSVANKTPEEIAADFCQSNVKTVLWEDSETLKILASKVAVLTGAGLCADCISFRVENGKLIMTRPAQGGNITADIVCTSERAFATVRTVKQGGADVIFSVGKGAADQIEAIKEMAKSCGAEVCASRIVADSGKMPYETQVGLTGKTVSPKVYVAFGISGAVQHTCAIEGAGTVIAVNTDKQARIFDYADYGIITEIKNIKL